MLMLVAEGGFVKLRDGAEGGDVCGGHTKCRYSSHIAVIFSTAAIVSTQNDIFIVASFWSATISKLPPLKLIYCSSFMSYHCRTPQKTIPIAAVPKKRRNM